MFLGSFPLEWEQRKLGEISDVTKLAGFEFTEHIVYSDEGNIIALRGLNVKNGRLVLDDVKYIDGSNFSKLSRSKLYINDVLFTYVGTVGELAIIPENERFYLAPNVSRIRFQDGYKVSFMIQQMGSKSFYDNMIFPLIATSSQPALSMENIRKFVVSLPKEMEEQERIGAYFEHLDHLITLHQREYSFSCIKVVARFVIKTRKNTIDWEQRKLGEILQEQISRTSDFEANPLFSLTIEKGITPKTDRYERGFLVQKDEELFKIVRSYEFVTNPMNLRFGALGYNNNPYNISVSGYYDVFSIDENRCSPFWSAYFKTPVAIRKFDNAATGSLIEKRRVKYSTLTGLDFTMPSSIEEKIKIGEYFKNLDHLITLHQRKPVLMYLWSGFLCVFHDWEQRKLGELVEENQIPIPTPKESYIRLGIRSHAKGTFHEKVLAGKGLDVDTMYVVEADNLIVNITFAWEHAIAVTTEEDAGKVVSHRFPQYKMRDGISSRFLQHDIKDEEFRKKLSLASQGGAGRNRVLNKTQFLEIERVVPIEYEEQRKIGLYFDTLDHLITLHQRKPF